MENVEKYRYKQTSLQSHVGIGITLQFYTNILIITAKVHQFK